MQPSGVVHPAQGGKLEVIVGLPGPAAGRPLDQLGLVNPLTVSAKALSKLSPTVPIEGTAPISASRSP